MGICYLDNAATTPVLDEVADVINRTMRETYANPSALYSAGVDATEVIENSRFILSKALGCQPKEVVFTASGSESNNIALLGAARARKNWGNKIVTTGYEHSCVIKTLQALAQNEGFELVVINPDKNGLPDIHEIVNAVCGKTVLVAAMHVNNETGALLDVAKLAALCKAKNPRLAFHSDGVQGFCKVPLQLSKTKIDSYAVSGHKIHAPKGIGALYLRSGFHIIPPFLGGGQENGVRPGTENVPYIAGFAKAVKTAGDKMQKTAQHVKVLSSVLLENLRAAGCTFELNSPEERYYGINNLSFIGYASSHILNSLSAAGIYVSSGSACSKGKPSAVLKAMGMADDRARSAIRISFSAYSTMQDVDILADGISAALKTLIHTKI